MKEKSHKRSIWNDQVSLNVNVIQIKKTHGKQQIPKKQYLKHNTIHKQTYLFSFRTTFLFHIERFPLVCSLCGGDVGSSFIRSWCYVLDVDQSQLGHIFVDLPDWPAVAFLFSGEGQSRRLSENSGNWSVTSFFFYIIISSIYINMLIQALT